MADFDAHADTLKRRREFLLKDCESIYRYIHTLAQMRLAALGASITIMGVITSHSGETELIPRFGIAAILFMLIAITVRMIAVLNRAVFVLFGHLASAEEEMNEVGFASYWEEYVRKDSRDSASHAFTLACRGLNVVGTSIAIAMIAPLIRPAVSPLWLVMSASTFVVLLLAFAGVNERVVRKDLDPKGFVVRMERNIRDAKGLVANRMHRAQTGSKSTEPQKDTVVPHLQTLNSMKRGGKSRR